MPYRLILHAGVAAAVALLAASSAASSAAPLTKKTAPAKLVDINTAPRATLRTLPGIGDVEADRIVACRPFLTKTELVTKKVLPAGPYLNLKDKVIAMQKGKPNAQSLARSGPCA